MVNSKRAFWQAFLFTIIVFGLGLILGFFFEIIRAGYAQNVVNAAEISLLDEQLRNRGINELNVSCSVAISSTFQFADEIYSDATSLEKDDASTQFSNRLASLHRKYDLLRTMLWFESISLKERCGPSFHTVVYLYDYKPSDVDIQAKQNFFSRILLDLKYKYPTEILLIPIATNTDLGSVDLALQRYGVPTSPAILIDERAVITDVVTLEELERSVFQRNK